MSEDLSDIVNNVKNMVDSGNIPNNIKEILANLNNNKSNSEPMMSNKSSANASSNNDNFNMDIGTIMKMKTIIDSMNQKDDPRVNLLYSLKPYLRENRKNKLDQYVNLLKMTKIADIMKNENKENNNDYK